MSRSGVRRRRWGGDPTAVVLHGVFNSTRERGAKMGWRSDRGCLHGAGRLRSDRGCFARRERGGDPTGNEVEIRPRLFCTASSTANANPKSPNDVEKWRPPASTPHFADSADLSIRNHVLGPLALPVHWSGPWEVVAVACCQETSSLWSDERRAGTSCSSPANRDASRTCSGTHWR